LCDVPVPPNGLQAKWRRRVIVVQTSVVELGLYRDEYEAFVARLCAEGFEARIDEDREEYRSVDQTAVEVGIWVADHILELGAGVTVVDTIRRAAAETISKRKAGRKRQRLKRLPIYGSGGRIHGWVDLPDDSEGRPSG
jgi:hypothetical protein